MPKIRDRKVEYEKKRLEQRKIPTVDKRALTPEKKRKRDQLDMEYAVALRKHLGLETL